MEFQYSRNIVNCRKRPGKQHATSINIILERNDINGKYIDCGHH